MSEITFTKWVHPKTGVVRFYANRWQERAGVSVDYYKSGAIRFASIDGDGISNRKAAQLGAVKVYVQGGEVHVEGL